jgi:uncharacterized protein
MSPLTKLAALGAGFAVALAGAYTLRDAGSARAGTPAAPQGVRAVLTFSGTGTASVRPDVATLHLISHGRGATLAGATDEASAAMRAVIAAMRAGGVAPRDLRTDDVSGSRLPRSRRYSASQSLTVTVHDVSHAGALIAAGLAAGADETYGPDLAVSNQRAGRAQALRAAVGDARAAADAAAAAAGLRVTRVVAIVESSSYPISVLAAREAAPGGVPVEQGTQEVTASVTVTFAYAAV